MNRRLAVAGAVACVLIPLGAVVGLSWREPALVIIDTAGVPTPSTRGAVAHGVLVISIDGLRADAIAMNRAGVLARLAREGAVAQNARTVQPSTTLPSHVSMLTGVPPEVHGITWNDDITETRGMVEVQTVFEVARNAGFTTAAFFSKTKLKHLLKRGTLDYASGPTGSSHLLANETVAAATRHIRSDRPNLVFVHLLEPDRAGHRAGWKSLLYRGAVRRADAAVGEVLAAAEATYGAGGYSVIVTADHGGEGDSHDGGRAADLQIPWIAWGAGVQPGTIQTPIKTTDTAATILWLLGVERPVAWTGRSVKAAYTATARLAVVEARARAAAKRNQTGRASGIRATERGGGGA